MAPRRVERAPVGPNGGLEAVGGCAAKLVADQLGHSLDVNQNVYTQSAVSKRQAAVNRLEISLNGVQTVFTVPGNAAIN